MTLHKDPKGRAACMQLQRLELQDPHKGVNFGVIEFIGFRAIDFRVIGFRVIGFRVIGFRIIGFRVIGFRV